MLPIQRLPAIGFGTLFLLLALVGPLTGQETTLLRPGQLFDGETAGLHEDWVVLVVGDRIVAVGPESAVRAPDGTREMDLPGPRLIVTTRAIVATGSYNPKGAPEWNLPKGAEEADGYDELVRVTRDQIGRGADWVKVYADYRWGPDGTAQPTFTEEELRTVVEVAQSSGRWVVAHATTAESMRRSVEAGMGTTSGSWSSWWSMGCPRLMHFGPPPQGTRESWDWTTIWDSSERAT